MNYQSAKKRKLSPPRPKSLKNSIKSKNISAKIEPNGVDPNNFLSLNVNLIFKMDEMMKEIQKLNMEVNMQKQEIADLNDKMSMYDNLDTKEKKSKEKLSSSQEYFYIS